MINLNDYFDIKTNWIALYGMNNNVTYSDSFGVEHISTKIKKCIRNKSKNIKCFRTHAYDSAMCGSFCIGFIDFFFTLCLQVRL